MLVPDHIQAKVADRLREARATIGRTKPKLPSEKAKKNAQANANANAQASTTKGKK